MGTERSPSRIPTSQKRHSRSAAGPVKFGGGMWTAPVLSRRTSNRGIIARDAGILGYGYGYLGIILYEQNRAIGFFSERRG